MITEIQLTSLMSELKQPTISSEDNNIHTIKKKDITINSPESTLNEHNIQKIDKDESKEIPLEKQKQEDQEGKVQKLKETERITEQNNFEIVLEKRSSRANSNETENLLEKVALRNSMIKNQENDSISSDLVLIY